MKRWQVKAQALSLKVEGELIDNEREENAKMLGKLQTFNLKPYSYAVGRLHYVQAVSTGDGRPFSARLCLATVTLVRGPERSGLNHKSRPKSAQTSRFACPRQ